MSTTRPPEATNIRREFEGAELGDRRLETRLVSLAERIRANPDQSFPDIAATEAELTALYRFLNNEAVSAADILKPHQEQTARRCAEARRVIVIHDTSEIEFAGESHRRGLGRLRSQTDQGFLLHASLAVSGDGSRRPLGVLSVHSWVRETLGNSRHDDGRKKDGGAYADDAHKESARWWSLIQETESRLSGLDTVHTFDREGDSYVLLRHLLDQQVAFVTRMAHDRIVLDAENERIGRVSEALLDVVDVLTLEVPLSRRCAKSTPRSTQAPREARTARLAVGARPMHLSPPRYIDGKPESLEVNVVYVHEVDTPAGAEPVAWVLITSEPVATIEQLRAVLEIYRTRWLIEEFFKALKTGCALEKRQLDNFDSISAALAIFLPIAWQLLLLRCLARTQPDESAELVLTTTQCDVIRAAVPALKLPSRPTVAQALRAVAYLGGHFTKRAPGWLVLARGLEKLLDLETGWQLHSALAKM